MFICVLVIILSSTPGFDSCQVLLAGGSIIYPIVASATTRPPQGHYLSDSGESRTHGSLQRCHRWLDNPRGITIPSSYADIQPSYDLTSDHSPIIATISTAVVIRKPTPRLNNAKTNWETYRQIIQEKAKLSIKLKDYKHIELETNNLIKVLHNAAKKATGRCQG